ncbi:DNA-binding transcriptional regulator, IclR family [Raineyella antarctica]|uniref:DNA-binding transcriptional regulator, IclR family n=1 Tax=Raineyella antarctica TaxID=1577474 RepID=A0A1G6GH98_9ACTN|nr:IclR family transcriptional regulator C-terminal domain-containing protein [Raineyella antarctica]SDB80556.1 DNA-binding transcriptional regulator, IclR family [Raineyella antarctica]
MNGTTSPLLRHARDLIDALKDTEAMSPAQLADAIDVPRSTVYRLVEGLTAIDLVLTAADGRVTLSQRWLALGDAVQAARTEWAGVRSAMRVVTERTGCTTYLSIPAGDRAMCIDWVKGRAVELLILKPGRSLPLYVGAAGRGTLAGLAAEDREAYLAAAPFPALTPSTLTTAEQLRADVQSTHRRGYVLSQEDVTPGAGALGVPVPDDQGRCSGVLSVGTLIGDLARREEELYKELSSAVDALPGS